MCVNTVSVNMCSKLIWDMSRSVLTWVPYNTPPCGLTFTLKACPSFSLTDMSWHE